MIEPVVTVCASIARGGAIPGTAKPGPRRARSVGGRPDHRGVSTEKIVDVAVAVVEDRGYDGLTTAEVARRLEVSQPTIYSHVSNLDQIRSLTAIRGMRELSNRVKTAVEGRQGDEAFRAMAYAYRGFVREHPSLYMLQQRAPSTTEFWEAAPKAARAVQDVLRTYGLSEDQIPHIHLVFRASVHGFVDQETNNAIPDVEDTDTSFELFLRCLTDGIKQLAAEAGDDARS